LRSVPQHKQTCLLSNPGTIKTDLFTSSIGINSAPYDDLRLPFCSDGQYLRWA
jgi:hypothetical protein